MSDPVNPNALPFAVPRSALPGVAWPAVPNGERHWPIIMCPDRVRRLAPILQHQLVQVALNELEIRLVVARALTRGEEAAVAEHSRASFGHPFRITFRYVDAIPRGPGGKFEEFLSEFAP